MILLNNIWRNRLLNGDYSLMALQGIHIIDMIAVLTTTQNMQSRVASWLHPEGAVESDHLSVQHRVLDDALDEVSVLLRQAEAGGEGHRAAQIVVYLLREVGEEGRREQPWTDGTRRVTITPDQRCYTSRMTAVICTSIKHQCDVIETYTNKGKYNFE